MILDPHRIASREKQILAGLFLSKFDTAGLALLGFESFTEAFNVIGFGLGSKPASIKNYRDEFDPLFLNSRLGWHKRSRRSYCLNIFEDYQSLDIESFSALIRSLVDFGPKDLLDVPDDLDDEDSAFARRLVTGLAAEHYFETLHPSLPEFDSYSLENTTRLGCGYDFRLRSKSSNDFLAVEVKGLMSKSGGLSLTPKEHRVASILADKFYLFVVKNFREAPFHEIYQNPLASKLNFEKRERVIIQVSWTANAG